VAPRARDTIVPMKRSLALILLVAATILAAPLGAATADDTLVRIASGRKGFTYRAVYARNLEKLMRGYKIVYLPSEGSGQNLDLLAAGEANIAFAQADVYAEKRAGDPERYRDVLPIGRLAPECVYIARRKQEPKTTLESLAAGASKGRAVIAVGDAESGMSWSWAYIRRLMPGLSAVETSHESGTLSLNQLALGSLDAVAWVTDPNNVEQKMLRALLANDRLELMPVSDPALLVPHADGTVIYEARDVKVGGGLRGSKVPTICTSAVLFSRRDASERLIDKLADVVSLDLDKIVPKK